MGKTFGNGSVLYHSWIGDTSNGSSFSHFYNTTASALPYGEYEGES